MAAGASGTVDEPSITAYGVAGGEGDSDMRVPETVMMPPGVNVWPAMVKLPEVAVYSALANVRIPLELPGSGIVYDPTTA